MSFDEIFDLTAGVYFNFYNIYIAIQLFFFFGGTDIWPGVFFSLGLSM